jgi:hypothetical protein
MKPFIVDWKIYPYDTVVFLGQSEEEVEKWLEKRINPYQEEKDFLKMYGDGRTVMLKGRQTVLWLAKKPKKGCPILAHEIFHVVSFLMDRVGIPLTNESDEAYAYAISYLTQEINKKLS